MTSRSRAAGVGALLVIVTALGSPLYRGTLEVPEIPVSNSISHGFAAATAGALGTLGVAVARDGAILRDPNGFAIEVTGNCTAWFPAALYLAGLVALRSHTAGRRRTLLLGVGGVTLIAGVNLARLVLVYLAGGLSPRAFEWAHHFAGEALLAGTVLLLWWWTGAPRGAASPAADLRRSQLLRPVVER